jgi:plastocyanin
MQRKLMALSGLLAAFVVVPAWASDHPVTVGANGSLSFSPATLTINTGDTVTFKEVDGTHNVVSDTGLFRCANGCDGDGAGGNGNLAGPPWSATVSFNTAGTFGYYCEQHGSPGEGMYGTIRVNAPAFSITPGITGLWYNSAQSGHGFDIEVLANHNMIGVWYVFDNAGNNLWLTGQGSYSGNTATLDAYSIAGGLFPPAFDQSRIVRTQWGTLTLKFTDCNTGSASWVPLVAGYVSGSLAITRLSAVSGLACP